MATAVKQPRIIKGTRVKVTNPDFDLPQSLAGMYGTVVKRDKKQEWCSSQRAFKVQFSNRKNPVVLFEDEFDVVSKKRKK